MDRVIREKVESYILALTKKVDPSGINTKMYSDIFKTITDEKLDELCRSPLPIYDPNGSKVDIDHNRNIEILKEMGYECFQRAWLTDPRTGLTSLTDRRHMIVPLPVRRQTQLIEKKISYAKHNRSFETLTGQVTGASKSSAFSFPQTYVMYAKGYDATLHELLIDRGGNETAGRTVDRNIRTTGSSSQKFAGSERTRTKSTRSTGILFNCMHIGSNLGS